MSKKFTRRIENFECENCGEMVKGSGYTNHCPKCLWSKHVDINPGDREHSCKGLMRPVMAYYTQGRWKIIQICEKCGYESRMFVDKHDDIDEITRLSTAILKG
ncbi:MAG: RNHCP domain-containing protein [Patescibacteria group bacterium]|nr:RNHCP domain-containing protein [Patescibacteria group bacterium]